MLFRTTDQFLRSFSLASIEDLPALPALEENEQMELNMDGTLHETPPGEQLRFLNGEPVRRKRSDRLWERFYSGF
mgnify:CR=1 FL=1